MYFNLSQRLDLSEHPFQLYAEWEQGDPQYPERKILPILVDRRSTVTELRVLFNQFCDMIEEGVGQEPYPTYKEITAHGI